MPGPRDITLDQHMIVAEAGLGLALAALQGGRELLGAVHPSHALAAAAGAGLDQHGVADAPSLARKQRSVVVLAVITRHQRHAGALHQGLGRSLAAHVADRARRRASLSSARLRAGLGEVFVFRQEAVARMDGLGAG
jgi:hypothetical protein